MEGVVRKFVFCVGVLWGFQHYAPPSLRRRRCDFVPLIKVIGAHAGHAGPKMEHVGMLCGIALLFSASAVDLTTGVEPDHRVI